jgi:hypothetical protein
MRLVCLVLLLLAFPATAAAETSPRVVPLSGQRLLVPWQDTIDWEAGKYTVNWRVGNWATLPAPAFTGAGPSGWLIAAYGRGDGVLVLGEDVLTGATKYGPEFGRQRVSAVELDAAGRPGAPVTLAFDAKGGLTNVVSGSDASGLTVAWMGPDWVSRYRTRGRNGWGAARRLGPQYFQVTRVARTGGRLFATGRIGRPGEDNDAALRIGSRLIRLGETVDVDLAVSPKGIVVLRQHPDGDTAICLGLDGKVRGRLRFASVWSEVVIDRSGRALLAHSDADRADDPTLYLKRLDRHCRVSGTQELPSPPTHPDESVQVTGPIQLALTPSGGAVAVWPTRRDLRVAFGSVTGAFGPSTLIASRAQDASLAIESSGRAIIGWSTEFGRATWVQWWSPSGPVDAPVRVDGAR